MHGIIDAMSELRPSFKIACHNPEALAGRITKTSLRVIADLDELHALGYQDEGVIVPNLENRELLTAAELAAIAVPIDTPDAMRLVRVPQRTHAFMRGLGRSGLDFGGAKGDVTTATEMSLKEAPLGLLTTTINPGIGRYVGLHIDALGPGYDPDQNMMGIVCGEGARGITFAPDINIDLIDEGLRYSAATEAEKRLERRVQIRQAAARLQGELACYTLWLEGSGPGEDTYEAYANLQPRRVLHDGTTYLATEPAAIQMIDTCYVTDASFDSIV